mmetsp:Transcript_29072/g.49564  ORF Transcript_29072/g.49564 Transcript_29072/m.49564 type:complete len:207 (-) Transcript_29072:448-1068(-)
MRCSSPKTRRPRKRPGRPWTTWALADWPHGPPVSDPAARGSTPRVPSSAEESARFRRTRTPTPACPQCPALGASATAPITCSAHSTQAAPLVSVPVDLPAAPPPQSSRIWGPHPRPSHPQAHPRAPTTPRLPLHILLSPRRTHRPPPPTRRPRPPTVLCRRPTPRHLRRIRRCPPRTPPNRRAPSPCPLVQSSSQCLRVSLLPPPP